VAAGDVVVTIVGNLTNDPELRFTPSGAAVASFTVASTPRVLDKATNEWKDGEALFMRCSVWRQYAENVAESLQKGSRVIVTGRLKQRSYETREGEKRTVMEMQVEEVGPSLRYATAKVNKTQRSGGGGGGFFNVGPEKVGKIKVQTVCLEHGKPDPNLRMRYELRPIESMTSKSEVVQLCKMLGRGEVPQNAAQAAAWNLANGLSWGELASKDRVKHLDGSSEKFFSPAEMEVALRIANEAQRRGQAEPIRSINPQVNTPGRQQ